MPEVVVSVVVVVVVFAGAGVAVVVVVEVVEVDVSLLVHAAKVIKLITNRAFVIVSPSLKAIKLKAIEVSNAVKLKFKQYS
jgi:hypothetical protein